MNNKGSAKTVYLVIIAVIATVCIIVGSVMRFGNEFRFSFLPIIHLGEKDNDFSEKDVTESFDDFKNITIETEVGDIRIIKGSEYSVSCKYSGIEAPLVSADNGELKIIQRGKAFAVNLRANYSGTIEVTVPADAELKDISIDNALGNIKLDEISADVIYINAAMGDVDVKNCSFTDASVDNAMGNVVFTQSNGGALDVDNSMGDVEADGFFEKIAVDCSMGDIKVENSNDGDDLEVDLETSMGDVKYNGDKKGTHYSSH